MLACPVSVDGVVCSGRGTCANGLCWCGASWSTSACDAECPGSGSACSGHGTCDSESGTCICDVSATDGSGFAGRDCSVCADGYSGALCTLRCPTNASGAICSGRGACFAGGCQCLTAYCGASCDLVVGVDDCGNCALPGLYGANCDLLKLCHAEQERAERHNSFLPRHRSSGLAACAHSSFHKSPSPAPETTKSQYVVVDELYSARNGTCGGQSTAGFHGAFAE